MKIKAGTTKLNKKKVSKRIEKKKKRSEIRIKKINKKITFAELVGNYPESKEILMKKGLHCISCHMAMHETIEQGALMHGLDPDKLVKELNKRLGLKIKSKSKINQNIE